jgi:hypothetical protein
LGETDRVGVVDELGDLGGLALAIRVRVAICTVPP